MWIWVNPSILLPSYYSRLSGIGGSGSFQLAYHFIPSPVVLAAQDSASDVESDNESIPVTGEGPVDMSAFQVRHNWPFSELNFNLIQWNPSTKATL